MTKILLALLVGLVALGGWNYQRNTRIAEEAAKEPRPYKSLKVEQLDQLLAAYTQEKTKFQESLARMEGRTDPSGSYAPSDLKGKVGGFERAQKQAARYNDVHSAMLDREVEIEKLQKERSRRQAGMDSESPWAVTLRRIVTF